MKLEKYSIKIAAVIVTYNRLGLLKIALESYINQTRLPDYLVIVNNASTDNTSTFLKHWKEENDYLNIKIITTKKNLGGSGGFYIGTKKAMELNPDWIWVSDDDVILEQDVFEKAENHIRMFNSSNEVSAICTKVLTDNEIALSNRSRRKLGIFTVKLKHVRKDEYLKNSFECDNFSYVGVLMNSNILRSVGLINPEYFIWRDDVEHSWRLSEKGKIICYPDMVVIHQIEKSDYNGISWKTYYAYRNDLFTLKHHCKRRYYYFKILLAYIHGLLSLNKNYFRLYLDAIKAANNNEKGLNTKYYPGEII